MLNEKLLTWNYYFKSLPLYLQNSYGYAEHFRNLYQILIDTNSTANDLLDAMNLFANEYFKNLKINKEEGISEEYVSPDEYVYDLLDKFAALYNVNRYFDVTYELNNETITKHLKLTNLELLILILIKIVQNNFAGTYEDIKTLYSKTPLAIYILNDEYESGKAMVILDKNRSSYTSDNIDDMFLANLLTIKSMGIEYSFNITSVANIGEWDNTESTRFWDSGVWL